MWLKYVIALFDATNDDSTWPQALRLCFYDEDDIAAERIERSYTSDEITFACSEVVSLKREPVPGVVERSILDRRTRIARDGKQQAQISALANSPPKNPGHNIKKIWSDFHQCKRE